MNSLRLVGALFASTSLMLLLAGCSNEETSPRSSATSTSRSTNAGSAGQSATSGGSNSPRVDATSPSASRFNADGNEIVDDEDLPKEAQTTLRLIKRRGPFPYRKDGAIFENREGELPSERRGCYREYTVRTPGSYDRGAKRVVTSCRGASYFTFDHYDTFSRIVGFPLK